MENRTIVLVDPIKSSAPYKAIAKEMGLKVIALYTMTRKQIQQSGHSLINSPLEKDADIVLFFENYRNLSDLIAALPTVSGVVASHEVGVEIAESLSTALNLPGNDGSTSSFRRNKIEMRKRASEHGLTSLKHFQCATLKELLENINELAFPVVLKAPESAGSNQVFICADLIEATSAFQEILGNLNQFGRPNLRVQVEEYLRGVEFTINLITQNSENHVIDIWEVDRRNTSAYPNVIYKAHQIPLSSNDAKALIDYSENVCKAFNHVSGYAHIEVKMFQGQIQLIEIASRLPGSKTAEIWSKFGNFCPFEQGIKCALGDKITQRFEHFSKSSMTFFPVVVDSGIISAINGIPVVKGFESFDSLEILKQPGDSIEPSQDLSSPSVVAIFSHNELTTLLEELKLAEKSLSLEISNTQ